MEIIEKNYFFIISVPKEEHIEFITKLNSFILKLFPDKTNPYRIKPLEIRDTDSLSKVIIKTTEEKIMKFSQALFGTDFEFTEHDNGDVEIVRKDSLEFVLEDENITRH
jgi:hypothetical protein